MHHCAVALGRQNDAQPSPAVAAPTPRSTVSQVLDLQRSVGNAAVARLLERRPRLAVSRDVTDAPPAGGTATNGAGPPDGSSRIAELAKQVGSANGLRAMLKANPGLAGEIAAYFAAGHEDETLNALMAEAFSPAQDAKVADQSSDSARGADKNPADPTIPLPADITGDKKLDKGQMKWTLKADDHSEARIDVDFKPDETKVEAKTVSFGQTVVNQVGAIRAYPGGTATDPAKNKATYEPFEEATSKKRADHLPDTENDPFYGAEWDQAAKKWKQERADWKIGSSTKGGASTSASMFDTPNRPWAREGLGDSTSEFETVAMVLETREPLGALRWGFKIKDAANAPIELTGAQDSDCTDAPSADWGATMDKFYEGKYAEILDDFDIGKAELKPDHKTKLDGIATKMAGNAALKAQLGGAADLTGSAEVNARLSLKRAEAARDYLVAKGVNAARLEVQSYGADWARAAEERGKSESKNRRVQIWLH